MAPNVACLPINIIVRITTLTLVFITHPPRKRMAVALALRTMRRPGAVTGMASAIAMVTQGRQK
jgi:hypothetical protein